jgi:hypothetical protein
MVAFPKQITKKWKLERGSALTLCLMSDGSVVVVPSEEEIEFQEEWRGENDQC